MLCAETTAVFRYHRLNA